MLGTQNYIVPNDVFANKIDPDLQIIPDETGHSTSNDSCRWCYCVALRVACACTCVCALHATPDDKKRWVLPAVGTGYGTAERFQGHSPTAYLLILNGEMFVIRSEAPYFLYFAAY